VPFASSIVRDAVAAPSGASAAGFAADLAWERCQEQAAIAFRAGDPITTTRLWTAGLEIAEKYFRRGDPRLASSLTNQALVMRRRRQDYQAKKLFRDALDVWDDSWRWIHLMTPGASRADCKATPSSSTSTGATRAAPSALGVGTARGRGGGAQIRAVRRAPRALSK
jgi:hypothetical protein